MKVVCDTNILVSALGWRGNPYQIIRLALVDKKIKLVVTMEIIEEFKETSREPKFQFSEEELSDFIDALMEAAELVMPTEKIDIIKEDSSDNKFLECAIESKADFIISGDRHLLNVKGFRGIKILTAREFLALTK